MILFVKKKIERRQIKKEAEETRMFGEIERGLLEKCKIVVLECDSLPSYGNRMFRQPKI